MSESSTIGLEYSVGKYTGRYGGNNNTGEIYHIRFQVTSDDIRQLRFSCKKCHGDGYVKQPQVDKEYECIIPSQYVEQSGITLNYFKNYTNVHICLDVDLKDETPSDSVRLSYYSMREKEMQERWAISSLIDRDILARIFSDELEHWDNDFCSDIKDRIKLMTNPKW